MLHNKTISVVIPAYNEELQILKVIDNLPDFVDKVIVVDDRSNDRTFDILVGKMGEYQQAETPPLIEIENDGGHEIDYDRADRVMEYLLQKQSADHVPRDIMESLNTKLVVIRHRKNAGVGATIASGYLWARENGMDCTAVMAGDGQMDPAELEKICTPVALDNIDYVKGNRLRHPASMHIIPFTRLFGNSVLSILTKIASGYWRVTDTQTGYTAVSLSALRSIALNKIYPRYGMPNDFLVKLNIQNCTLQEILIKPVYAIGEQSKMKIHVVIPKIGFLLLRRFGHRIVLKYFIREFHPLFLLYVVGGLSLLVAIGYLTKILYLWITLIREINELTILAFLFTFLFGFQSLLFAMWMDIRDNERLYF